MRKNLFLLCPTDGLEFTINKTFNSDNYFYTSLGNSFVPDSETIENIKELIEDHAIEHIYFVLSKDNQIISDAFGPQFFSDIRGLKKFYTEITQQKKHLEGWLQTSCPLPLILSYYLNQKIKELQLDLSDLFYRSIKVNGKIYDRYENAFKTISTDLIYTEKFHLN